MIPDWMQNAGWEKREGSSFDEEYPDEESALDLLDSDENQIEQTDMPDWIKSLAPQEDSNDIEIPGEAEKLDILDKILPLQEASQMETEETDAFVSESTEFDPDKDLFRSTWDAESITAEAPDSELEETTEETALEEGNSGSDEALETEEIPDWLKDFTENEPESTTGEPHLDQEQEFPDWLETLHDDVPEEIKSPDTSKDLDTSFKDQPPSEIDSLPEKDNEWLEQLAQEHDASQETLISPANQQLDTPPEWVFETGSEENALSDNLVVDSIKDKDVETSDNFSADSLFEIEPTQTESPSNDLPGLNDLTDEAPSAADQNLEHTQQEELDEGFAWLESLAAKQGADEGTLILEPEDRVDAVPDWLAGFGETQPSDDVLDEASLDISEPTAISPQPSEKTDRWISEFEQSPQVDALVSDEDLSQQTPDIDIISDSKPMEFEETQAEDSPKDSLSSPSYLFTEADEISSDLAETADELELEIGPEEEILPEPLSLADQDFSEPIEPTDNKLGFEEEITADLHVESLITDTPSITESEIEPEHTDFQQDLPETEPPFSFDENEILPDQNTEETLDQQV